MSVRQKMVTFSATWAESMVTLPFRKNPKKATSIAAYMANSADCEQSKKGKKRASMPGETADLRVLMSPFTRRIPRKHRSKSN